MRSLFFSCTVGLGIFCGGLLSCSGDDLGRCNLSEAQTWVYDENGTPATGGQALIYSSCGRGSFCHSAKAEGSARFGVPAGLNFDIQAITDPGSAEEATAILRSGFSKLYEYRFQNWAWIKDGTMPPGKVGRDLLADAPRFIYDDGSSLPAFDTAEGKEAVRNWFACAPPLPIVERTSPHPDVNYIGFGDVVSPKKIDAPDPKWASIYPVLTRTGCNSFQCHDDESKVAGLDLSSQELAYASLVDQAAADGTSGAECGNSGLLVVKPGDADASLLVQKLENTQNCGSSMPLDGPLLSPIFVNPIRDWINAGALDN
ncbi:MAG: hypothetical protein IPJ88_06960 [Myxococcales bacterium]|nr:MAG: hypothetical protein IPJ88_06960 [Myxococcales bacterium]